MKKKLMKTIMPMVPKNLMSRGVGELASTKLPGPLAKLSLKAFVRSTGIDINEAEHGIDHYQTIHELFTRKLKPGVRPLGDEPVNPADGKLISGGEIINGKIDQVKGLDYSVLELIRQTKLSEQVEGGWYVTTYLSPKDYHRVHSPVSGEIFWVKHIPGDLWPVYEEYIAKMPQLYVSNERLVVGIETPKGVVVVVFVGATNVGKISLTPDGSWLTNQKSNMPRAKEKSYEPKIPIKAGDELGIFHMGSTIVTLFEKSVLEGFSDKSFKVQPCRVNSSLFS